MATYYVKNGGNDALDGLSDTNAWETIAKVNATSFNPGDIISFNRGDTWREQLTIPSSGISGNAITFNAYGSGNKPVISGADLVTGMLLDNGTVYSKVLSFSHTPEGVWYNDVRITYDATKTTTLAVNTWNYVVGTDTLWVNVGQDPATSLLEVARRQYCIYGGTYGYINISNINCKGGDGFAIYINGQYWVTDEVDINNFGPERGDHGGYNLLGSGGSDYAVLKNGMMTNVYGDGIYIFSSHILIDNMTINPCYGTNNSSDCIQTHEKTSDDITIQNCHLDMTGSSSSKGCIRLGEAIVGMTGWVTVKNCDLKGGNYGVNSSSHNTLIEKNYIHDAISTAQRGGIFLATVNANDRGSFNTVIIRNNIFDNCRTSFYTNDEVLDTDEYISNVEFYNNTIINPAYIAIDLYHCSVDIKNNIVWGVPSSGLILRVRETSGVTVTSDYNVYYQQNGMFRIGPAGGYTSYDTLTAYQIATGQDLHSIISDPLLELDYLLKESSPCLYKGIFLSEVEFDYFGNTRRRPPCIGAHERTAYTEKVNNQMGTSDFMKTTPKKNSRYFKG